MSDSNLTQTDFQRYVQLAVLVIIAGNIYPLIYLRQNFEVTILDSFGISASQLGEMYAMLGILYVVTYLPSGWLADRVSPRILMSFSLLMAGLLGVWFSTFPDFESLKIIFAGWGIAAGLTFWAALIKATAVLAKPQEQGRFFGILDGGRGLVEAVLASIAVYILATMATADGLGTPEGLRSVIYMYVGCMLVLAPLSLFLLKDGEQTSVQKEEHYDKSYFWDDLKLIATKEEIWLCAVCILTGYQLFWATYSFSAFLQTQFGLTAVAAGVITVAKLWTRPIGAVAAGFAGDFFDREKTLGVLLLIASISLFLLVVVPVGISPTLLLIVVLAIGLLTYGVRGIFWATLDGADVSNRVKGLAIGIISLIGYSPDIYLPLLNGHLLETHPGREGYNIYFSIIAGCGFLGALAAWRLKVLATRRLALV